MPQIKQQFKIVLPRWPTITKTLITTLILSSIITANRAKIQIIIDKTHFIKLANTINTTITDDIYQIYHLNN